jgi:hypothetical protein
MCTSFQYLFAPDLDIAERAARNQGWDPQGRSGWIKADGNEIQFICSPEQFAAITKDTTIYYVGELTTELRRFRGNLVRIDWR